MKAVYEILDALESLDYSDPTMLNKIPYEELVNTVANMFQSRHKDIWYAVWKNNLYRLQLGKATPDQMKAEVCFQFMQMFRSMLILDAKVKGKTKKARFTYEGPKDDKTRNFCYVRVGKSYTEHQILDWQDLSWEGKIEDGGDIFVDLGGYNCRHYLVPEGYTLPE